MTKHLFNDRWSFSKHGTDFENIFNSDIVWENVDVPHDWLIYDVNNLYDSGVGLYKKELFLDKEPDGQVYRLYFEGVYMDTSIYVNESYVCEWKYGYSSFECDISNYLHRGCNTIIVKVLHQSPNTRWYSGAGIYRNVWLNITGNSYLVTDGIYIHTVKKDSCWDLEIETEVVSGSDYKIKNTLYDDKNNEIENTYSNKMTVSDPKIWDIDSPCLYTLTTELIVDEKAVDFVSQKIGFKTVDVNSQNGFYLNGRHIKLNGVCEHHDLGALGAAFNKTAMCRKFTELKKMGVNSLRTSHNMPAKGLMELTDEMGILVVSEAFDMWESSKTTYDYARFFKEWHERDVASWVRRDRNHASLIMWSVGNEIYDAHAGARGLEVTKILHDNVRKHDPKKNGFTTFGSNYMQWENSQKCGDVLDISGYNYGERLYNDHHKSNPDRIIYGSETASTIQSRGIYHFPAAVSLTTHTDKQCSSLNNCSTAWGARTAHEVIMNDKRAKFSLGQFIWTGFDYIGEPTPYTTKNSYFGQIDTAGYWKDTAYLYQAEWTDYRTAPMVHIAPYWDFNVGQIIDIIVYSNAPSVELFFNGKSLGKHEFNHDNDDVLQGSWQIAYLKGELKAVAYDENGNIIAEDIKKSFGDASTIKLTADKTSMYANGEDLIFVDITTVDENGIFVENANNRVNVQVKGAGRLVGLDNGDSTDYDQYKGTSRRLFSGRLLAIIAAKKEAGEITVDVESEGLEGASLLLLSEKCCVSDGVSCLQENKPSEKNDDVPCRKIELIYSGTENVLSKNNNIITVTAKLFPTNTTNKNIKFTAVNNCDIETSITHLEQKENEVIVTALGDGDFRLRAYAEVGDSMVYSELEFKIEGLGPVAHNPYKNISAGLYDLSKAPLKNADLGGIAMFSPDGDYFGYKNIDFGVFGSDEISIAIMSYATEIPIEFWEGVPQETGSELLLATTYKAKPRWNTYIENTFTLDKKLRGKKTLCVAFKSVHTIAVKDIVFIDKSAYEKHTAADNKNIYGDSYTVCGDTITGIGNNVTLDFGEFNFYSGVSAIELCGCSHVPLNSVHIKFVNSESNETVTEIVEVSAGESSEARIFALNNINGKHNVSFVFLPGSDFDFAWFKFS